MATPSGLASEAALHGLPYLRKSASIFGSSFCVLCAFLRLFQSHLNDLLMSPDTSFTLFGFFTVDELISL